MQDHSALREVFLWVNVLAGLPPRTFELLYRLHEGKFCCHRGGEDIMPPTPKAQNGGRSSKLPRVALLAKGQKDAAKEQNSLQANGELYTSVHWQSM